MTTFEKYLAGLMLLGTLLFAAGFVRDDLKPARVTHVCGYADSFGSGDRTTAAVCPCGEPDYLSGGQLCRSRI